MICLKVFGTFPVTLILGISMIEMATGKFPYPVWGSPFEQLKQVEIFLFVYFQLIFLCFN